MYHAVLSPYIPSCNFISTRLRYYVVLPPYIPSGNSSSQRLMYHAVLSTYIQTCNSISQLGIATTQCYHPTSKHAIPSVHGLGIMQSYQPTSKHANSISQVGIANMQYVLSSYIQTCNSISPRLRYHAVLSTYIQTCQFHQPSGHSYYVVRAITLHPVMQFHHSTACRAIRSAHKICSYPISQRTVAMPPRPLEAKTGPVSIEESCLHTALQLNRNCLARYIPCPSQYTWAVC